MKPVEKTKSYTVKWHIRNWSRRLWLHIQYWIFGKWYMNYRWYFTTYHDQFVRYPEWMTKDTCKFKRRK